jgi:CPA2 family monovalent cation:H+ antiporter-2
MVEAGHSLDVMERLVGLLLAASGLAYACHAIRLPPIVGYLLAGALLGPTGLGLIADETLVNSLSRIGILFLLFIIGLELSTAKLQQLGRPGVLAGILQIALTTLALTGLLSLFGIPFQLGLLLAAILSLSSTAIVLKSLEDVRETDSVHGRLMLGILIVQDLFIIPLMTLVPLLSAPLGLDMLKTVFWTLLQAAGFLLVSVVVIFRLAPFLLDLLASAHRKELFTLAVTGIGLGMAVVTAKLGLSPEAGAFIAGLSLSGSVLGRQVMIDSRPFRDVFATLFFVSVGMKLNGAYLLDHLGPVMLWTLLIMVVKALTGALAVGSLRYPPRTMLWVAIGLCQVGEFSFVILQQVLSTVSTVPSWTRWLQSTTPLLIHAIILSMLLTPLLVKLIPVLNREFMAWRIRRNPALERRQQPRAGERGNGTGEKSPVIVGGYGPIAKVVAAALQSRHVPLMVVEMNVNTVKQLQEEKIPCVFGDITHPEILKAAGIDRARALLLTMPDARASEAALHAARQLKPDLPCIARARYYPNVEPLRRSGADLVVYEELECGLQMAKALFQTLGFPAEHTNALMEILREREASQLALPARPTPVFGRASLLGETKLQWLEVHEGSPLNGKTLISSELRQQTGAHIIAIIDRSSGNQEPASPSRPICAGDILVAVGTVDQLHRLERFVGGGKVL